MSTPTPTPTPIDDHLRLQAHIDNLLQQHLILLDQYTHLRERLSRLHSSTLQDIARANFSAQRGQRFGRDQYDGRMRALRRLVVEGGEGEPVRVLVVKGGGGDGEEDDERGGEDEREGDHQDGEDHEREGHDDGEDNDAREQYGKTEEDHAREGDHEKEEDHGTAQDEKSDRNAKTEGDHEAKRQNHKTPQHAQNEQRSQNKKHTPHTSPRTKHDPLRWFGILSPPPLRAAQAHAVEMVEQVIPQLVSVAAQMQHLEIEVRRARKKRDKMQGRSRGKDKNGEGRV
ncbi:hypothetical protein E4U55_006638 [Claviceps digitariae]|nr:hypothetical protein E4U55_006638 [Claviceps digitariae]